MRAKLAFLQVVSRDLKQAQRFYSTLFGFEGFARALTDEYETYQMPIAADGIHLQIGMPVSDNEPRIIPYFAVDDLASAVENLQEAGGKLIVDRVPITISERFFDQFREKAALRLDQVNPGVNITNQMGIMALMLDNDNNPVGLIQLEEYLHYRFGWGKFYKGLTDEQYEDHITAIRTAQQFFFEEGKT